MKRFFFLLLLTFPLSLFEVSSAQSICSTHDRIALAKAGYSQTDMNDLCQQDADQAMPPPVRGILWGEGQARWVQWCATPQGRCPLFSEVVGYYPVGFPCNCYMPWGFYSGTAE